MVSASAAGALTVGQMVCVEFTTRTGRAIRLLGCLADATEEHLMVDALDGSSSRPGVGDQVVVSTLIGRSVQQASTTVLVGGDLGGKRMMVRRPAAFLEANRRRHQRVGVKVPVSWFEIERGPGEIGTGHTIDVSIGGLMFSTSDAPIAPDEHVVLLIELPGRTIAGICVVRSVRPDPASAGASKIGIEWSALADLDRAALAQLG